MKTLNINVPHWLETKNEPELDQHSTLPWQHHFHVLMSSFMNVATRKFSSDFLTEY